MKLIYVTAVLFSAGIVLCADNETATKTEIGHKDDKVEQAATKENHVDDNAEGEGEDTDDKRGFGRVLGGGFMGAGRYTPARRLYLMQNLRRMSADKRKWGSVLGHGFLGGGKRDDVGNDFDEVYMDAPIDEKRSQDYVYNYPVYAYQPADRMKRSTSDDKRYYHYYRGGFVLGKRPHGDFEEMYPDIYNLEGEEGPIDVDKRFRSLVLGRGFVLGKRSEGDGEESVEHLDDDNFGIDKRYGFLLNKGFSFGKFGKRYWRNYEHRHPFGNVLGHGLTFGKRFADGDAKHFQDDDNSGEDDMEKRGSLVLGRGYVLGKRGQKRFGWVLGRGLKFGKRSSDQDSAVPVYFIDDAGNIYDMRKESMLPSVKDAITKRYGLVLGKGFSFGKRSDELTNTDMLEDDSFVPMAFGYDDEPSASHFDKRYGSLLGKGFVFRK